MLSESHNFIFVHIGKNGGNSISKKLAPYCVNKLVTPKAFQDGVNMFDVEDPKYGLRKHASLAEYKSALNQNFYARAYKFAVTRNPFDRLISIYYAPNRVAQNKVNVNNFIKSDFLKIVKQQRTFRDFVKTNDSNELTDELDQVLKFSKLTKDFEHLQSKLKLDMEILETGNKSMRLCDYRNYYDDEMIQRVYDKFHEEIDFFEYAF